MLMSATLPDVEILRAFYPQAQVVADIEVATPHMRTVQVIGALVSQNKLTHPLNQRKMKDFILRLWMKTGRKPCLVIAQMGYEKELLMMGLPANITVRHFNNISGLDGYKGVPHVITVGRTQPPPNAVERYAGAMTGIEPVRAERSEHTGDTWAKRTELIRGDKLPDRD
jgi:hypothetical protein